MTIQQMRYILALEETRHFVSAAEKCFVTQPTLTAQLKKIEEEIGKPIFDRSSSPIKPTEIGWIIIQKAQGILQEVAALKSVVNELVYTVSGVIKIAIIPTVSPYLVPQFVGEFTNKYPSVKLHISEMQSEEIIQAIHREEIDVGVLVTPINERGIREIPIYYESFVFFGADNHELLTKNSIKPTDIKKSDKLWLLSEGHCFRNQLINICGHQDKADSVVFESGSIETIKKMVRYNGGYTLVPELSVGEEDRNNIVQFSYPKPHREVSLISRFSYAKEGVLRGLKEEILAGLPKHLSVSKDAKSVLWR